MTTKTYTRGWPLLCRCFVAVSVSLLLLLPSALQAQFTFITNNGALTITGYTGQGGDVVIPSATNGLPVTDIRTNAFFNCTNITSLTVPGSITVIAYKAFTQCTGVTNVTIGNGTLSIEDHAFYDCAALLNVVIPVSVTNISSGAFRYCFALSTIALDPANPSYSIVDGVLFTQDITTLVLHPAGWGTTYTIPAGVQHIADYALASCYGLTSVDIPEGVLTIGNFAFDNLFHLQSVKLPDSLVSIGYYAFEYCGGITDLNLGQGVSSIGTDAFNSCKGLTSISIPASVTNMGDKVFWYCTGLTSAHVSEGVTSIGNGLFYGCSQLPTITLPATVTTIGAQAFASCNALSSVYFSGDAPAIGSGPFVGDPATVFYLAGTAGWDAPQLPSAAPTLGVRTNRFGFTITGSSGIGATIQACTNLANPVWSLVRNFTITNDSYYFSDPFWLGYSNRFYRLAGRTYGGRPLVPW